MTSNQSIVSQNSRMLPIPTEIQFSLENKIVHQRKTLHCLRLNFEPEKSSGKF